MEKKQTMVEASNEYKHLKMKGSQLLLFLTLIVGLLNTIGTLWIVFRLNLISPLRHLDSSQDDVLLIRQDILTDSFTPYETVEYKEIIGDTIKISSQANTKIPTEINLNNETISMQAKIFSSSQTEDGYAFKISRRLQTVETSGFSQNVKTISSHGFRSKVSSNNENMSTNLDIVSDEQLELSGNIGLRVHVNQMYLESSNSIKIQSREESIILLLEKSLHLPALLHESYHNELLSYQGTNSDTNYVKNVNKNNNRYLNLLKYQLCIVQNTGMIYLSSDSC